MSDEGSRPSTQEEMRVAFAGAAPAADRVFATAGPAGIRLAFAEQDPSDGSCHFRTAVMLSHGAAYALGQMLREMITVEAVPAGRAMPTPPTVN